MGSRGEIIKNCATVELLRCLKKKKNSKIIIPYRADKCVIVNEEDLVYYDYLFLFTGEQFKYSVDADSTKSDKKKTICSSKNSLFNM